MQDVYIDFFWVCGLSLFIRIYLEFVEVAENRISFQKWLFGNKFVNKKTHIIVVESSTRSQHGSTENDGRSNVNYC